MKQNKKRKWILFAAFLACLSLATIVYAGFFRAIAAQIELAFAKNNYVAQRTITVSGGEAAAEGASVAFSKPGDKIEIAFTAKNSTQTGETAGVPLSYTLQLHTEGTLACAVFATLDGTFLGTLDKLGSAYALPAAYYLGNEQSRTHILTLELHIGAGAFYQENRTCKVTLQGVAQEANLKETTFVNNASELRQTFLLASAGLLTQNRIVLNQDITLDAGELALHRSAEQPLTLDLNGRTLNLQTNTLAVTAGTLLLENDFSTGAVTNGGITVNGETALVAGNALDGLQSVVFTAQAYNKNLLVTQYVVPQIAQRTQSGLRPMQAVDVMGGYRLYQLPATALRAEYNAAGGTVTPHSTDTSRNASLTFENGSAVPISVVGAGTEERIDELENTYLRFLKPQPGEESVLISNNVYLPQYFKEYNCSVEWWSSDPAAFSPTGKYVSALEERQLDLVAKYTINGAVKTRTYRLRIKNQSPEELLSYFLAKRKVIELTELNVGVTMWTENTYAQPGNCDKDLGIVKLAYTVPDTYRDFLQITESEGGPQLKLTRFTVFTNVEINVEVTFDSRISAETYQRSIPVLINLDDRVSIDDMKGVVTEAAQRTFYAAMLENQDYLDLPMQYEAKPIAYYVPDALAPVSTQNWQALSATVPATPEERKKTIFTGHVENDVFVYEQNYQIEAEAGIENAAYFGKGAEFAVQNTENARNAIYDTQVVIKEGKPYYRLYLNTNYLQTAEQKIYLVAYFKQLMSNPDGTLAATSERCVVALTIPAAVRADAEGFPQKNVFDVAYAAVGDTTDASIAYLSAAEQQTSFILMKKLKDAQSSPDFSLDFSAVTGANFPLTPADFAGLSFFTETSHLNLSAPAQATSGNTLQELLPLLGKMPNLKTLQLSRCGLSNLAPLNGLTTLEVLDLSNNEALLNATNVANFAGTLRQLNVAGCSPNSNFLAYNEWALAYCYYKALDESAKANGGAPTSACAITTNATPQGDYYPQYPAGVSADKVQAAKLSYKTLVYTAARLHDPGYSKGSYVWLPRKLFESPTESDAPVLTWAAETGVTLETGTSGYEKRLQFKIENTASNAAIGKLRVEANIGTQDAPIAVVCDRYFFFH